MFNLNKNENKQENKVVDKPSPPQPKSNPANYQTKPKPQTTMNEKNIIGEGTEFEGTLKTKGDIRIDGTFNGTITSEGKLSVTQSGSIEGDVFCKDAEFDGEVSGNVKARGKVIIKPKAHIKGDVRYYDLQVEPGAHIACTISRMNPEKENLEKDKPSSQTSFSNGSKQGNSISKTIEKNKTERKNKVLPLEEEAEKSKHNVG